MNNSNKTFKFDEKTEGTTKEKRIQNNKDLNSKFKSRIHKLNKAKEGIEGQKGKFITNSKEVDVKGLIIQNIPSPKSNYPI